MGQFKPPSSASDLFFIGRNGCGNWIVQNQHGTCGGTFVDRTEALRFALFENGHRPHAVVMVPGIFDPNMNRIIDVRNA